MTVLEALFLSYHLLSLLVPQGVLFADAATPSLALQLERQFLCCTHILVGRAFTEPSSDSHSTQPNLSACLCQCMLWRCVAKTFLSGHECRAFNWDDGQLHRKSPICQSIQSLVSKPRRGLTCLLSMLHYEGYITIVRSIF
ncbi:hypothetical protein P153DRAFT_182686 [Dothidotthia symphoricarpi CBS 119687]|uniref:Secreted protein n=1 Tax=Dothidotthia symphoricarpi CBS 119687 TaxID=1392245 RepID=A0A6A6ALJ4_9PLEO|nr:uncharacterized protein P153DRAFT_182686 [Dothidotthia symphoricarpi CBS 119687]KAF2131988.1 hypothetical protein P153DRAFT_182686 [Dothidotthia symphoricarpi CBS 119687]